MESEIAKCQLNGRRKKERLSMGDNRLISWSAGVGLLVLEVNTTYPSSKLRM